MEYLITIFLLPILFIVHDAEELLTQRKWIQKYGPELAERFPKARPILEHLGKMTTKAFAIAAFEELVVILLAMYLLFVDKTGHLSFSVFYFYLYCGLYYAFILHTLVHIVQCFVVGHYVPGLVTSILMIPLTIMLLFLLITFAEYFMVVVFGIIFSALNLLFAHWLAFKICGIK